jgi:O-succinylbenzoic acid--CoA ligase
VRPSNEEASARAVAMLEAPVSTRGVLDLLALWSHGRVAFPLPARETHERLEKLRRAASKATLTGPGTVLCTSGSTGRPKLVVHELRQHLASARAAATALDLGPGNTWLLNLPLHHVGGLAPLFRALVSGARLAVPAPGEKLVETLRRRTASHLSIVAAQLRRCLDDERAAAALASARVVLCGGGPFDRELLRRALERGVPIAMSYGSTETASLVTLERDPARVLDASAGAPLAGRQVCIDGDGQILVAGNTLLSGYLEDGRLRDPRDAGGWFATGDLGRLDEAGRLTVIGRRDRMLVSGGENIHPEEIERALLAVDGVVEAVVEPFDDAVYGQRPAAFVRLAPGRAITADDLRRELGARLARFKIPDRFARLPGREPL